jgi:hypothetical protein
MVGVALFLGMNGYRTLSQGVPFASELKASAYLVISMLHVQTTLDGTTASG